MAMKEGEIEGGKREQGRESGRGTSVKKEVSQKELC